MEKGQKIPSDAIQQLIEDVKIGCANDVVSRTRGLAIRLCEWSLVAFLNTDLDPDVRQRLIRLAQNALVVAAGLPLEW